MRQGKRNHNICGITLDWSSEVLHVFQTHVRRVEASGLNMAILRRYVYFLAPADHEDYHSHGWYQCQYRKDTSRIEQDK